MKVVNVITNLNYDIISGDIHRDIKNIAIDSRRVIKGSMFFCISGLNVDGHNYIEKAIENGANTIIIDKDIKKNFQNILVIKVKDSREALAICASNFFENPSYKFDLIGVTGTNGKTSITYFIEQVLRKNNKKTGVIGTTGALINGTSIDFKFDTSTTPDAHQLQNALQIMQNDSVDVVVMEVTSQALHQKRVQCCDFDIAVFTNITQDHLDYHINMKNYVNAKKELFTMAKKSVINMDDEYSQEILKSTKGNVLTYSINADSDLQAKNIVYTGKSISFDINIAHTTENIFVNVPGKFTVYNVLGSIGALLSMGLSFKDIKESLKSIEGVPGRIQSVANNKGISVLVDYAHSPDGLENIIKSVREFTTGKVITVFGCGGDRDKTKRPIMGKIAGELSNYCIVTSDNPRTEVPETIASEVALGVKETKCDFEIIIDRREAIFKAISLGKKGDSIIIAGKGHENYQIFATDKIHFDDVEVAREAIELQ